MLDRLHIKNIALIPELTLELQEGLNILSGETGAGKSIIIDALNFVLGERADRSLIRHNESFALVEAHFYTAKTDVLSGYLSGIGVEFDGEILLSRIMNEQGRNECRINGRQVTLGTLKMVTAMLADIHGQHEHQSLLNTENHLPLLDKYAEKQIAGPLESFNGLYAKLLFIKAELASYMSAFKREQRLEILRYQIEEIEKAAVKENEEEDLINARYRLHNNEKYINGLNTAYAALSEDEFSAEIALTQAIKMLNHIADLEPRVIELIERLNSAKIEIKDVAYSLSEIIEQSGNPEATLEELERRLSEIRLIKKKYGKTEADILSFLKDAQAEYEKLFAGGEKTAVLEERLAETEKAVMDAAKRLSGERKRAAKELERQITLDLIDLGMKNTVFEIWFKEDEPEEKRLWDKGIDNVEFLISPNLGEPLKPLSKIISGGEMSRFMLALKNITSELDGIETMVFDEIDTGISGKIAQTVAEKLSDISKGRQVIAVTHLPQLAGMADKHYLIAKEVAGEKTVTVIKLLDGGDRIAELARLMGGQENSRLAKDHAEELVMRAAAYKNRKVL